MYDFYQPCLRLVNVKLSGDGPSSLKRQKVICYDTKSRNTTYGEMSSANTGLNSLLNKSNT